MTDTPDPTTILSGLLEIATQFIRAQLQQTAAQAALELRSSAMDILGGSRSGQRYMVPGTRHFYTASAPGEAPAVRTGALRLAWMPTVHIEPTAHGFVVYPGINLIGPPTAYAAILDPALGGSGAGGLNRPFVKRIQEDALPRIEALLP